MGKVLQGQYIIIVSITAAILLNCQESTPNTLVSFANRGEMISYQKWTEWTAKDMVEAAANRVHDASGQALLKGVLSLMVTHDVVGYDVTYHTIDVDGNPTIASGSVIFPSNMPEKLPILSYQHGTTLPRFFHTTEDQFTTLLPLLAGSGFMAVAPHYLGHEASGGFHPYVHKDSLASASLDMLRAAKQLAEKMARPIDTERLFLLGYSEGGYATAALQRELETTGNIEFHIRASAPSAGPYDVSGAMVQRIIEAKPYQRQMYIPYILVGFDDVYHIYPNGIADFIKPQYQKLVTDIFRDNRDTLTQSEADDQLPNPPIDTFSAQAVSDLKNPASDLAVALKANDIPGWIPRSPTKLYHCQDDDLVPYANAEALYKRMLEAGADSKLLSVEKLSGAGLDGHLACSLPILLEAFFWFRAILFFDSNAAEPVTPAQQEKLGKTLKINF